VLFEFISRWVLVWAVQNLGLWPKRNCATFIPQGFKPVAGGKRSATTGIRIRACTDEPNGVAACPTNSATPLGSNPFVASDVPVVVLRLPPATLGNHLVVLNRKTNIMLTPVG